MNIYIYSINTLQQFKTWNLATILGYFIMGFVEEPGVYQTAHCFWGNSTGWVILKYLKLG